MHTRQMLTSVVSFPTVYAASRDETANMRLAPGRRAGDGAWAHSFREGSRSKGNFGDAGAVTMDMALHSAFPASAMAYGYSVDSPTVVEGWEGTNVESRDDTATTTNDTPIHMNMSVDTGFDNAPDHINFNSTDHSTARYAPVRGNAVQYTPPPSAYTQTIAIPRGAVRASAAAIRLASPPPPRTRRRRDASIEHTTPHVYRHTRAASASTRVSSSEGGHAHDVLLPAAAVTEQEAWGTSAERDVGLEGAYAGEPLPAEERALLQRTGISSPVRARRASAAPRRRSAAGVSGAHVRAGSNGLGAGAVAVRHRTHATEDPGAYIRKRGSAPPAVRRFFGWEFGREASGTAPQLGADEEKEASFIDLRGRNVKAKRQSLLSGIVSLASGGGSNGGGAVVDGGKALVRTPSKLRRRSHERSRAEGVVVPSVAPDSPSALAFCLGRLGSRASRRALPGNAPPPRSPEATPRTTQLKKSFRLGVGRTMGPGLTLAVAAEEEPAEEEMTPAMRERQRYYNTERAREAAAAVREWVVRAEAEEEKAEGDAEGPETSTEEGADDDGEVQSIATARLVSASIARATPAATIVTAPGTPLRAAYRASYSSGFTASPTQEATPRGPRRQSLAGGAGTCGYISPQSPQSPGVTSVARTQHSGSGEEQAASPRRASWKPHPFADPAEEVAIEESPTIVEGAPGPEADVEDDDDDMVQLEREMAEMNAQNEADDERALHDLNASLSAAPAPEAAQEGRAQKRLTMSSPPASKSDWEPQVVTSNGFAYRFPMIFGASSASSSRSDSPPHAIPSPQPFQQVQQPGTQRSTPNLRLSSRTMDTVRSAFAGVGARMSSATSRMSVTSSVVATPQRGSIPQVVNAMIAEDSDGDFMDLRDPFAPPPLATTALPKAAAESAKGTRQWDNFLVIDAYEPEGVETAAGAGGGAAKGARTRRRRMSAWGRLPMPARTLSPVPSSGGASVATGVPKKGTKATNRLSRGKGGVRKTRKEKRTRKATLSNVTGALATAKAAGARSGEEDADFGIEEALLSQRLLRRLNSTEWEILSS